MSRSESTLLTLFEEQVVQRAKATAVTFDEDSLSYDELNQKANRLARYLVGLHIGPEDIIALAMPRSLEMIVCVLGVLKAGAAYLPLDLEHPAERLNFMLQEAGAKYIISSTAIMSRSWEHGSPFHH